MHSNVTIKNVSWPHFSWPTLYIVMHDVNMTTVDKTHVQHRVMLTYLISQLLSGTIISNSFMSNIQSST